jgi:hypothetical protein
MAKDNILSMSTIDKSPIIIIGGEEIVDLTKGTFSQGTNRKIGRRIIIDKSLSGRPHLVSKAIYKSQNMIDLLFSYNGYSNPLTISAGDMLYVPTMKEMKKAIVSQNSTSAVNTTIKLLKNRLSTIDQKRIKFLMGSSNNFGDIKTPNMNESVKQFNIDVLNNKITLGSDNTSNNAIDNSIKSILNEINK